MTKKKIIFRITIIGLLVFILLVNAVLQGIRNNKAVYVPIEYEKYTAANANDTICEASIVALIPMAEEKSGSAVLGYYFYAILDDMTIGAVYMGFWHYDDYKSWIIESTSDWSDIQRDQSRTIRGKIIDIPYITGNMFDYFSFDGIDYDKYRDDTNSFNESLKNLKALDVSNNYPDTKPVYPNIPVLPAFVRDLMTVLLVVFSLITAIGIIKARKKQ